MAGWRARALWWRVGKVLCGRSQVFGQAGISSARPLTYVTAPLPPHLGVLALWAFYHVRMINQMASSVKRTENAIIFLDMELLCFAII